MYTITKYFICYKICRIQNITTRRLETNGSVIYINLQTTNQMTDTMHDTRCTIHDTRCTLHDARYTLVRSEKRTHTIRTMHADTMHDTRTHDARYTLTR